MKGPFEEKIMNTLYDVFRATGTGLSVPQLEALRKASEKLGALLTKEATLRAIDLLESVQERVVEAVGNIEKRIDKLEERIDRIENSLES